MHNQESSLQARSLKMMHTKWERQTGPWPKESRKGIQPLPTGQSPGENWAFLWSTNKRAEARVSKTKTQVQWRTELNRPVGAAGLHFALHGSVVEGAFEEEPESRERLGAVRDAQVCRHTQVS